MRPIKIRTPSPLTLVEPFKEAVPPIEFPGVPEAEADAAHRAKELQETREDLRASSLYVGLIGLLRAV